MFAKEQIPKFQCWFLTMPLRDTAHWYKVISVVFFFLDIIGRFQHTPKNIPRNYTRLALPKIFPDTMALLSDAASFNSGLPACFFS